MLFRSALIERGRAAMRLGAAIRPAAVQMDRAAALAARDPVRLEQVQRSFEAMGARPFVARVRYERALLTGDAAEKAAALGELERIGDLEQIARYEQREKSG